MRSILLLAAIAALAHGQQQKRDLAVKDVEPPKAPRTVAPPRSYALVVGIAKYQNLADKDNLQFSERDAESIYSVLISPEGGSFPAQNVHRLIGPRATLANIRRELEEWLPSVTKDGDRVLVYFAGHGFVADGRAYLAPYDIRPENIASSAYPMQLSLIHI